MTELTIAKEQLKAAIDELRPKLAQYHQAINSLGLPELPRSVTDFGENSKLYNSVIEGLEGVVSISDTTYDR